ncbi:hypothetical protein ACE7GA_12965 [Roseomonas sp. CCTCC AB2023176]|uniref:hypothetical protein n=1 Tax=Roseomonas sp. CCTCC AB2023176 TaxID=3342640 RepID=UPI0035E347AF
MAGRYRSLGLEPRVVRPSLARWAPPATHAAAEDAWRFAWEWLMSDRLATAGVGALPPREAAAAIADLPSLVPRGAWPAITPDSEGRFRRRVAT